MSQFISQDITSLSTLGILCFLTSTYYYYIIIIEKSLDIDLLHDRLIEKLGEMSGEMSSTQKLQPAQGVRYIFNHLNCSGFKNSIIIIVKCVSSKHGLHMQQVSLKSRKLSGARCNWTTFGRGQKWPQQECIWYNVKPYLNYLTLDTP